jgi:hypothetical protein
MTFEEAVRKSIRAFMKGEMPTSLIEASGGKLRYDQKFFDDLEKDILGEGKKSKKKEEDE